MKRYLFSFLSLALVAFLMLPACSDSKDTSDKKTAANATTTTDTGTSIVEVNLVTAEGLGVSIGTIEISDVPDGVQLAVSLRGLPPGERGFHIHENGDCGPTGADGKIGAALAAGGHYDPAKAGKHLGPDAAGHKGDLPFLIVNDKGVATQTVQVKGLTVKELKNRSIMIHAGGDNYSDVPDPLGGGGARIACGVIK